MKKCLDSLYTAIVTDARDYSIDKRDAWIYGIIIGWDHNAIWEVAKLHGWSKDDVCRLRDLREEFVSLQK